MKNLKGSLKIGRLALDTSVIVEYIVEGSEFEELVSKLLEGRLNVELYVNPVTLSEVLYVAERIYRVAGIKNSNARALEFILWLENKVKMVEVDEFLWKTAGEIKKIFHISLPDAYAIATGIKIQGKTLFRKAEKEMEKKKEELMKKGVIFLDELSKFFLT